MRPLASYAPQALIHLFQLQPLVRLANPVHTPSLLASKIATCAGPAPTGCSSEPARERRAARALLERFQKMDQ